MSKDIRSFFKVTSKTSGSSSKPEVKKKPAVIIDSDEEDVIKETPDAKSKSKVKKRKVAAISSDSEGDSSPKKANKNKSPQKNKSATNSSKLKPVNITEIFGNTPIKQSKVVPVPKPDPEKVEPPKDEKKKRRKSKKGNPEAAVHDDADFEKTLLDLDDDILLDNVDLLDKTIDEALTKDLNKENEKTKTESGNQNSKDKEQPVATPSKGSGKKRKNESPATPSSTQKKKVKLEHTDSGMDPGEEAFEKRRYSAMLYQKYVNRGGPKNHGKKELPKGKADCLKNLCFLRTGVLDSLESNEFDDLIKEHGGRVVHGVSKKVNYLVVGEDPGPSKLAKAEEYKIPNISEDELLDMILVKSGQPPKYVKNVSENLSEDLGIGTEEEVSPKSNKSEKKSPIKVETITSLQKLSKSSSTKPNLSKLSTNEKDETSPKKSEMVKIKTEKTSPQSSQKVKIKTELPSKIVKSEDLKPIERVKVEHADTSLSWTEKYKPVAIKGIIGQQGDGSVMHRLRKWLQNWDASRKSKNKIRPSPWAKGDDGSYFKCALLSGSPGIGKTTTATLVAKDLGFDVVEFNASDTRSKKLLHQEVATLLSTTTLAGFVTGQSQTNKKRVLLMDEVDGMAGNEDRGGMQELINLIKTTHIPIICMCNDRNHTKMRSLSNYCFDLKVTKPRLEQIRGAMMSICFKEGLKMDPQVLTEIINGTGCDIRQTLNHLSLWTASEKNLTKEQAEKEASASKKDTILGPWEVCRTVFTESDKRGMSISDKSRLFFYDYSLGPLFVQQNYLGVKPNVPNGSSKEILMRAALASDAISYGDIIDSKIRRTNNWSLLESQAMYSSVLPGHYMSGQFVSQINFPSWLGNNSKKNKCNRFLSELHMHTRTTTSASKLAIKLDYLRPLRNAILLPLKNDGTAGVEKAVEVMNSYNLLRDDLDYLVELCKWKNKNDIMSTIDSKVKAAFTRLYNKKTAPLPYAPASVVSKKKAAAADEFAIDGEEEAVESDEETEDVTKDSMIKVKTKEDKPKKGEASTSKKSEPKKGKGKAKK